MTIELHEEGEHTIAQIGGDDTFIYSAQDFLDLLMDCYYQGADGLRLHQHHFSDDFYDLKTKLAGDVLQKCSNYRMKLEILGDFSNISSDSLRDFIRESNRGNLVKFKSIHTN